MIKVKKLKFIKIGSLSPVDTSIPHIRDFTQGNINNAAKDRHPLWNDLSNNNLNKPFYHGVVGPSWRPQDSEIDNGKNIISSPIPKPDHNENRVIANDLPATTFSSSFHFDLPLRKDVQQITIPTQVTKTTTERFDPRLPLKQPVETFSGTLIHNTGSTNERLVTGLPTFLEKSQKYSTGKANNKNKNSDPITMTPQELAVHAQTGISHTRAVVDRTTENLGHKQK